MVDSEAPDSNAERPGGPFGHLPYHRFLQVRLEALTLQTVFVLDANINNSQLVMYGNLTSPQELGSVLNLGRSQFRNAELG
jgi:hypothetical protein